MGYTQVNEHRLVGSPLAVWVIAEGPTIVEPHAVFVMGVVVAGHSVVVGLLVAGGVTV